MLSITKKWVFSSIGILLCLCFSSAFAQLRLQVTKAASNAIPLVIYPSQGPQRAVSISSIVEDDLGRSGRFVSIQNNEIPEHVNSVNEITSSAWQQRGIQYIVHTNVRGNTISLELADAFSKRVLLNRAFTVKGDDHQWRRVGHQIADAIYEVILGVPGAFDTRVAYVSKSGRNYRLVVSDADGAYPQTILDSVEPILSPSWSPDGRRLAYASLEGKRSQIVIQDLFSGRRNVVLNMAGINSAPSWSPDGARLVFTLSKDGNPEIYTADVNGGGLTRLTQHPAIDTEPVWGRDGMIYFTSDREGNPQVFRMTSTGGNVMRVTYEGNYNASPTLSEDGKWLATMQRGASGFGIGIINLQTGSVKRLTNGGKDESPSFSSNGHMIIYSDGRGGLSAVSSDGSVSQRFSGAGNDVREPSWSPRSN